MPTNYRIVRGARSINIILDMYEHNLESLPVCVSGISTVLLNDCLHQRVRVQSQRLCPLPSLKSSQAWHQLTISDDKTEQHDTIIIYNTNRFAIYDLYEVVLTELIYTCTISMNLPIFGP